MYIPDHFRPAAEDVRQLLARHGAADLITATPQGLRATMLPMIYVEPGSEPDAGEHGLLRGHFARKNDHWRQHVVGEALAIFRGPNAYVSPTWYATKREHGRVVPTWNYITAHVHGRLSIQDDPAWVERNVRALSDKHESDRDPSWAVDDAPPQFIAGQLRAIVGVELLITRIEAKFKLSQNRSHEDVEGVVAGLLEDDRSDVSASVRAAAAGRKRRQSRTR